MKNFTLQTSIKVWYRPHPKLPKVLWPVVDVTLTHKGISLPQTLLALVDSGANISILHPLIAKALGFDLKKLGAPSKGLSASGVYESWTLPEPVEVAIYGYTFSFQFTVINNPNLMWTCILGGDSIFQVARIDFQKFKGYFEVRFRSDIN